MTNLNENEQFNPFIPVDLPRCVACDSYIQWNPDTNEWNHVDSISVNHRAIDKNQLATNAELQRRNKPRGWGEPPPDATNNQPSIHALVIKDMADRLNFGLSKYKTPLQIGKGRNSLKDAYEEVLDLVVYLRTALEEQYEKDN